MLGYYQELYNSLGIAVAVLPFSVLSAVNLEMCYQSAIKLENVEVIFR